MQHTQRMNVKVLQDLPKYIPKDKPTSAWRLGVLKQKCLKKLVFWLFESGLRLDGIRSAWGGGVGEVAECFI